MRPSVSNSYQFTGELRERELKLKKLSAEQMVLSFAHEIYSEGIGEHMKDSAFSLVYNVGRWMGARQMAACAV